MNTTSSFHAGATDHVLAEQARLGHTWDLSYIRPALAAARAHARSLRPQPDRYSFEPVARHARLHGIDTVTDLAVWLGCSREQIYRLQRNGMSWMVADRLATYLNMHPTALWPHWDLALEVLAS